MADIAKLTDEAEKGQGCQLKADIEHLPFEESIQVLKQIADLNKQHREAEREVGEHTLPDITLYTFGTGFFANLSLSIEKPDYRTVRGPDGWENPPNLVQATLGLYEGRRYGAPYQPQPPGKWIQQIDDKIFRSAMGTTNGDDIVPGKKYFTCTDVK